ncbi:MAG: hypothetical protein M0Z28_27895 [Rhodospirillales bacterium]|nr:hypothetical protein [Rhodospirillales bacterium]
MPEAKTTPPSTTAAWRQISWTWMLCLRATDSQVEAFGRLHQGLRRSLTEAAPAMPTGSTAGNPQPARVVPARKPAPARVAA